MEPDQIFLTRADQNCDVFNNIVNENFQQKEMENNRLICICDEILNVFYSFASIPRHKYRRFVASWHERQFPK
jgi:hypothetical protein